MLEAFDQFEMRQREREAEATKSQKKNAQNGDDKDNSKSQKSHERGGVLAFLPGLMEIDTLYKRCVEYIEKLAR
jgi:hypothetical protein